MKTPFSTETSRLEAFSDGVIAVIITIMVLELKPPQGVDLASLAQVGPTFAAYVLSFIFVGIYWNNHHHMLRAANGIDGRVMWANLFFLFWLSLAPFATRWLGEHPGEPVPTAIYGIGLFLDGLSYSILQFALRKVNGTQTAFARAVKTDVKGIGSLLLYAIAIAAARWLPSVSYACFVIVAIWWFVPDRRYEEALRES